jgi:hypothetical protein
MPLDRLANDSDEIAHNLLIFLTLPHFVVAYRISYCGGFLGRCGIHFSIECCKSSKFWSQFSNEPLLWWHILAKTSGLVRHVITFVQYEFLLLFKIDIEVANKEYFLVSANLSEPLISRVWVKWLTFICNQTAGYSWLRKQPITSSDTWIFHPVPH